MEEYHCILFRMHLFCSINLKEVKIRVQVLAATIRSIASYFYLLSTDGIPTDTDKQGMFLLGEG